MTDWCVLFIVVVVEHCFPCGVKFLRMDLDTYNYYAFTHRILPYLVFQYKTPLSPFNQLAAGMLAKVLVFEATR